jgi:hypothetical protein
MVAQTQKKYKIMKIAAIYSSPYNNQHKRLELLEVNHLPKNSVNLVAVEKLDGTKETGGLPYCMYNNEIYHYKNGQYYHEKYMEKF